MHIEKLDLALMGGVAALFVIAGVKVWNDLNKEIRVLRCNVDLQKVVVTRTQDYASKHLHYLLRDRNPYAECDWPVGFSPRTDGSIFPGDDRTRYQRAKDTHDTNVRQLSTEHNKLDNCLHYTASSIAGVVLAILISKAFK